MVVLMRPPVTRRAIAALVLLVVSLSAGPVRSQSRRVVRINAERFSFTPSEVVVDAGEEVELRLKSDDTAHGFRIAGTNVNIVIPKRGRAEAVTTLRLTEPGRYTFECSRMCGAGHNFMRGTIVVRDRSHQP
jgi:cytochrome c oxidase subunit 2